MSRLGIVFALLLIVSALALVDSQHRHRRAFIELERAQQAEARLQIEWNHLQLEQSRLTKASLIAEAAARDIRMQSVAPARTLYVSSRTGQPPAGAASSTAAPAAASAAASARPAGAAAR